MVIQAENGILNLTQYLFKTNAGGSLKASAQAETHASHSVDSFAKALEQKVEQRISERSQQSPSTDGAEVEYPKNKVNQGNSEPRMSNEKLNKSDNSESIDEKLKELKKALKKESKKTDSEMETMIADLLATEGITMEQLEELASMLQSFSGMKELDLSQSFTEVMNQLPEELVDQIKELTEMVQQMVDLEVSPGNSPIVVPEESAFYEKLAAVMESIESIMEDMGATSEAALEELSPESQDLAKVLTQIQEMIGKAASDEGVVKKGTVDQLTQLGQTFEMVEQIEQQKPAVELKAVQAQMNQESQPVTVHVSEVSETQQNSSQMTQDQTSETPEKPLETPTAKSDEILVNEKSEGDSKSQETAKAEQSTQTQPQQATQSESSQPLEQTVIQTVDVNQTVEVSKIQATQVERVHQNILNQVVNAANMSFNLEDETSEMLIKLKPNSLGNVELKVSIEKGVLLAEFNVESQIVKEALESNLADLRNALSDKGFNVYDLNVSVGQEQKNNQNQQQSRQFANRFNRVPIQAIENGFVRATLESYHNQSTIDYLG